MDDVTVADAKARLSALVDQARHGEPVRITRRGKPVARVVAVERAPQPIDLAALRALTDDVPLQAEPARCWVRAMRDGALLIRDLD